MNARGKTLLTDTETNWQQVCFSPLPHEKVCQCNERSSYLVQMHTPKFTSPTQVESLTALSSAFILCRFNFLFCLALLFSKRHRGFVCYLPALLSRTLSPWLTGDNYALLSSYCQAQFATQINWAAFEERGGRGEGENEAELQREREKARDKTITNQQYKQINIATQASKIISESIMSFPASYRSHICCKNKFSSTPITTQTAMCVYFRGLICVFLKRELQSPLCSVASRTGSEDRAICWSGRLSHFLLSRVSYPPPCPQPEASSHPNGSRAPTEGSFPFGNAAGF